MKRFNKHTISILLICSSIALLLVFQFLWLRKVYEEQRTWLQKEANTLFQNTISELQDSIFQSNIEHPTTLQPASADPKFLHALPENFNIKTDTFIYFSENATRIMIPSQGTQRRLTQVDSFPAQWSISINSADSMYPLRRKRLDKSLRIASGFPIPPDSIRSIEVNKALQRVIMKVQGMEGSQKVVIRLDNDTLPIASVENTFTQKLQTASMPLQFNIQKFKMSDWHPVENELIVGPVPAGIPPREFFTAQLLHYDTYLFQKIVPQLLFSLFLTGITALAFWLIYRNLRQQERLTALKNDFISNVTHELKTPIATVSVAIEALSNFNALQNPQLTKEYLDISKNELNRLTILVDKVLKMSIFEQKEPELQLESINVKELVQQITASMRLQFEKYHAEVNVDATGEDFMISGDRLHLTSVIYNLVDNALKYSPEDPKIDITLAQQNGHLHVIVVDNGIGIAPEYKNRVFEKFFRVPTGDVHNVKGYGLGLNYVASVVQKHGGKIEVESAPGEGSCFTVVLPRSNNN